MPISHVKKEYVAMQFVTLYRTIRMQSLKSSTEYHEHLKSLFSWLLTLLLIGDPLVTVKTVLIAIYKSTYDLKTIVLVQ